MDSWLSFVENQVADRSWASVSRNRKSSAEVHVIDGDDLFSARVRLCWSGPSDMHPKSGEDGKTGICGEQFPDRSSARPLDCIRAIITTKYALCSNAKDRPRKTRGNPRCVILGGKCSSGNNSRIVILVPPQCEKHVFCNRSGLIAKHMLLTLRSNENHNP